MARPFRLGVVGPFPPHKDGDAHYTGRLVRAIAEAHPHDVEVRVWTHIHPDRGTEETVLPNLSVAYRTGGDVGRWERARRTLALEPEIEVWRPDCVHVQAASKPVYGGLMAGEPATWLMERLMDGGVPVVNTVHNFAPREEIVKLAAEKGLPGFAGPALLAYTYGVYRRTARASSVLRLLACGRDPQTPRDAIGEIGLRPRAWEPEPHPCDHAPVSPAARDEAKRALGYEGKRLLVAMGFVDRVKGYHTLLAASDRLAERYPDVRIVIAGEALRPEAQAYAEELRTVHAALRHPQVTDLRLGFVDGDEWGRLFAAADVVVAAYSSTWGPSGPVHHALGRAKPVVVSNVPNNKDLKGLARIVEREDPDSLFDGLRALLDSDEEREALGCAAGVYAAEHTWARVAEGLLATCRRVAEGRG